jgi:hypothetical protein
MVVDPEVKANAEEDWVDLVKLEEDRTCHLTLIAVHWLILPTSNMDGIPAD